MYRVGKNGAGKTTFTKLLLRLYAPNEGHIYLNGIDISEYDYFEYLKLFSPVFQDYAYMLMTLKDNVITSNNFDEEKFNGVMEGC